MWPLERSTAVESIEKMASTVFKVKQQEDKSCLESLILWTLYWVFGNLKTRQKSSPKNEVKSFLWERLIWKAIISRLLT